MDIQTAIYRFCNYQERSQQEVRNRLYELGAYTEQVNMLIADLIETGLLNEERFAKAFVRGKFRLKHWGRIKILHELKPHRLSQYVLSKALKEIDSSQYFGTAVSLAERKLNTLRSESNARLKADKVYRYLKQKGYEHSIIVEAIASANNTA